MPNHYCHAITVYPKMDEDEDNINAKLLAWATDPCKRHRPVPPEITALRPVPEAFSDAERAWVNENWGTKWDTYEARVIALGGDGSPVLVTFQTAWGPMNEAIMEAMCAELRDLAWSAIWVGMDPYNDSQRVLAAVGDAHPSAAA